MSRFALLLSVAFACPAVADDWPQYLGPKRDGVWHETGIVEKFPAGGPKKVWTMPVSGGYAGPAVADGKVFVTDRVTDPAEAERVFAFDANSGKELWKYEYPVKYRVQYAVGPRATPTVDGDRVYALGAMGELTCLNTATGKKVWAKNYVKDYDARTPIWGFAAAPLIDGDNLICLVGGKGGKVVVAFDKKTGKERWASQTLDETDCGYCPPVIYTFGKVRTLVIWHGAAVVGLNPGTGERLWKQDFVSRYALTAPMPVQSGDTLFLTAFYNGPLMLKINGTTTPEVLWKGNGRSEKPEQSDKLHSIIPTPIIKDGHIYGVGSYGELRCLKLDTGERVWATRKPTTGTPTEEGKPVRWANAFLTVQGDRFFLFNDRGELIIAKLNPKGYEEIGRAKLLEPTTKGGGAGPVVWVPPAFAGKKVYVRNDKELVCYDLAK